MQENWQNWEPISGLSNKYIIDLIKCDSDVGFQIKFSECRNKEKKILVTFKNGVFAYREADEKIKNYAVTKLSNAEGLDIYSNWTFFKVTNSSYLKWLSEESGTLSEIFYGITNHYAFAAENMLLEVADNSEPIVEVID